MASKAEFSRFALSGCSSAEEGQGCLCRADSLDAMHGRGEDETGCPGGEGEGFNGGKDDASANVLERSMIAEGFKSMTGMTGISSIQR